MVRKLLPHPSKKHPVKFGYSLVVMVAVSLTQTVQKW
jgi:hypothetical protein